MIELFSSPRGVGLVTGLSSAVAVQVAQTVQQPSVLSEWTVLVGVGAGAVGWGIAWGSMRTKLAAQEVARKELKADTDRVAVELKVNDGVVAAKVEQVAAKVDDHTDKLRAEIRETAKEHRTMIDTVLREVAALSATLDTTVRDTQQMITEHILSCPAIGKSRKR